MDQHYDRWCKVYSYYIEEWYTEFQSLFNKYGFFGKDVPVKKDFYYHCYINTRADYYCSKTKTYLPPLVLTPRLEEQLMYLEEDFLNSQENNRSDQ